MGYSFFDGSKSLEFILSYCAAKVITIYHVAAACFLEWFYAFQGHKEIILDYMRLFCQRMIIIIIIGNSKAINKSTNEFVVKHRKIFLTDALYSV